jgi:hypothetical protein
MNFLYETRYPFDKQQQLYPVLNQSAGQIRYKMWFGRKGYFSSLKMRMALS